MRRKCLLAGLLCAMLALSWPAAVSCSSATTKNSANRAEELSGEAVRLVKSGKGHERALKLFRKAVKLAPERAKHHINLGQMLMRALPDSGSGSEGTPGIKRALKTLREAEALFQTALEIKPENSRAQKNVKKLKKRRQKLKLALKAARQPKQRFKLHIPRVTMAELARNKTLLSGHWPYVITDAMKGWAAMEKWNDGDELEYLESVLKDEWVDFYSQNMYSLGNKPILYRFSEANKRWRTPFHRDMGRPRYMQFRLSLPGWLNLKEDLRITNADGSEEARAAASGAGTEDGRYLPNSMWTEDDWIHKCLKNKDDVDNFFRVNQWNMLLIGEEGTGIFFHHDHLASASWQAHVVGRKEWIVCPYDQTQFIGNAGGVHAFDPDYSKYPNFARALCGKTTAGPGDLLYYPAYWWHTTKCLDRPTIGITGLMVGTEARRNDIPMQVHERFKKDLELKCSKCWDHDCRDASCRKCDDISKKWPGAAPPIGRGVCDSLNKCYKLWDEHYKSIGFEENRSDDYTTTRGEKSGRKPSKVKEKEETGGWFSSWFRDSSSL